MKRKPTEDEWEGVIDYFLLLHEYRTLLKQKMDRLREERNKLSKTYRP